MPYDAQIYYVMLALPALFGLSMVGEGLYKMSHLEGGWGSIVMGSLALGLVAFGYFFVRGLMG